MYRRALMILICVAGVAAFATGCGEDSSSASPTRAEFAENANEKCKALTYKSARELEDYAAKQVKQGQNGLTRAQQEELLETVIIPRGREQIEALEELGFPEGSEPQIEAIIDELDRIITGAEEEPLDIASEASPFAKSEKLAKAYGLRWCGHQ